MPATAIFPIFLRLVIPLTGGLDIAAIFLMLIGMQWYLLFSILAGTSAISQDLKYTLALTGHGSVEDGDRKNVDTLTERR